MTIGVWKPRKRTLKASPKRRRQDSRKEIGRSSQRAVCRRGGAVGPAGRAVEVIRLRVSLPAPVSALCRLGGLRELGEAAAPAVGRADRVAHLLPPLAVTVEVAMLEHDERAPVALGREGDLELARLVRVELVLPRERDVPRD